MQTQGTLSKWNDDKGFGYITPKRGGPDIYVHASAFPQDGRRPQLHEKLSFTVETDSSGKRNAAQITRLAQKKIVPQRPSKPRKRTNSTTVLASFALLIATLAYGYIGLYREQDQPAPSPSQTIDQVAIHQENTKFQCNGRTLCSQMTSCQEAEFFLHNCPNVQLDGNGDGIPCEQQWCGKK
jgi:cold shock CspA family protein